VAVVCALAAIVLLPDPTTGTLPVVVVDQRPTIQPPSRSAPGFGTGDLTAADLAALEAHLAASSVAASVPAAPSGATLVSPEAPFPAPAPPMPVPGPPEPPPPSDPCAPSRTEAPPGAEGWLDIQALGLHLPIVPGGQATIDADVVAHYEASDWLPPVPAGAPGAYWLAAHDTCGLFATLPEVPDGAEVSITSLDGEVLARYWVTARTSVDGRRPLPWSTFYRWGDDRPYAVLQTCTPGSQRLLVYALG